MCSSDLAAQLIALQPSAASITAAQAARAAGTASATANGAADAERFQQVDLDTLELVRARSVGVEHAALAAMGQCGLEDKLAELGLNRPQIAAAVGNIIGRMASPGSEPATLAEMLTGLGAPPGATVVMDAGIATEANLKFLRDKGYHYVVVSRLRERQFDPTPRPLRWSPQAA